MTNIEKLLAAGGNRWTKNGKDRIYMNAEQLGLDGFEFAGRKISKSLARDLASAKTYYDIQAQRIVSTSVPLAAAMADLLGVEYSYGTAEIDAPETEEETAEEIHEEAKEEKEETTMTIREFVENLYNGANERPTHITIEDARRDLANYEADEWDLPEDMTAEAYMDAWNALVDENEPDRPKTTDVIRFRVTAEERARIQALADRMSGGNVSKLIKQLIVEKEANTMTTMYATNVYADVNYDTLIYRGYSREDAERAMEDTWDGWSERQRRSGSVSVYSVEVPAGLSPEDALAWAEDHLGEAWLDDAQEIAARPLRSRELRDVTRQESGLVIWPDSTTVICNWSGESGLPRVSPFGLMGDGREFAILSETVCSDIGEEIDVDELRVIYDANGDEAALHERLPGALYRTMDGVIIYAPDDWN